MIATLLVFQPLHSGDQLFQLISWDNFTIFPSTLIRIYRKSLKQKLCSSSLYSFFAKVHTVDGRNPAPVEVGSLSHCLHPWSRISSIHLFLRVGLMSAGVAHSLQLPKRPKRSYTEHGSIYSHPKQCTAQKEIVWDIQSNNITIWWFPKMVVPNNHGFSC